MRACPWPMRVGPGPRGLLRTVDAAKPSISELRQDGMRAALPLLITGTLLVAPVLAMPTSAAAAEPTSSTAIAMAAAGHKAKLSSKAGTSRLRVTITGSPVGQVQVVGWNKRYILTESAVMRLRVGRYTVRSSNVSSANDTYRPDARKQAITVRKGVTARVQVTYSHAGSSAPGTVRQDTPPAGELTEVFNLVNTARSHSQQCGTKTMPAVDALAYNADIGQAAQLHAEDMAAKNYFEHVSLDGRTFVDRINGTAYDGSPAGENIAMGFQSAAAVVQGWLDSPGHCVNLMDPDFDDVGLGFTSHPDPKYSTATTFWVQDFGYAG